MYSVWFCVSLVFFSICILISESSDYSPLLIQEYAKSTRYLGHLDDPDAQRHQGNSICGDDITVYLRIDDGLISDYRFDGNTSMVTHASASFVGDLIIWSSIDQVLMWTEQIMLDNEFVVSKRRRRASVIAILSCRNAIHQYRADGMCDTFDDLLDGYPTYSP